MSDMNEIILSARMDNLNPVIEMIEGELTANGCPMNELMQISMACEEIFVNIATYGYIPGEGDAKVKVDIEGEDSKKCIIIFEDMGHPFNPLEKKDPDVTLDACERPVGGLGIYMVKNTMDSVDYQYKDGRNILTLVKNYET